MQLSKNRVDTDRYKRVLFYRICPGCSNYVIVDVTRRSKADAMNQRGSKYLGTFHSCGGPHGHLCWNMTLYREGKPIYETFGPKSNGS
jgi:hypothetical protein